MNPQKVPTVSNNKPETGAFVEIADELPNASTGSSKPSPSQRPAAPKRHGPVIAIVDQPSATKPRVLPAVPNVAVRVPAKGRVKIGRVSPVQRKKQQLVQPVAPTRQVLRAVRKEPLEVIEIGVIGNKVVSAEQLIYPPEYMERLSSSISTLLKLMQPVPPAQQGPTIN